MSTLTISIATNLALPRRLIVIVSSVKVENFVLLLVILGYVMLFGSLAEDSPVNTPSEYGDLSGQTAKVESEMKKPSGVIDRKIENAIGKLRKELSDKIERKTRTLEAMVRKLQSKSEGLDASSSELKSTTSLSKIEFKKLVHEFNKAKGSDGGSGGDSGEGMNLDAIRAYARDVVLKEIGMHGDASAL